MSAKLRQVALLGLLGLGTAGAARAQATEPPAAPGPNPAAEAATQRYAVAHDSLMQHVRAVYGQAETRASYFAASQGSFGGLHRRVSSYAGITTRPVKRQVVKHRSAVELEKVTYYDVQGRTVLAERYEDHRLVRLELWEYPPALTRLNRPTASWLLVRGDYLRHKLFTAPHRPATSYYHHLRPPGEAL